MPKTSLAQEFQKSAEALHAAFPDKLRNLVILLTSEKLPVYVAPEIAERLTKNIAAVKEAVRDESRDLHAEHSIGISIPEYPLAGTTVRLIAINDNPPGAFSASYTKEMESTWSFDHEIGHLVIRNGNSANKHLAECAADAYAALRHVQRFGTGTGFPDVYNMAYHVILGISPEHYTDAVIQKVKDLSAQADISGLSQQDTALLAGKIAAGCYLNTATLEKISTAYLPVTADCKDGIKWKSDAMLQDIVKVMQIHKDDPDIFEAGKRYMNKPEVKKILEDKAGKSARWKAALDFITRHEPATAPVKKAVKPKSYPKR